MGGGRPPVSPGPGGMGYFPQSPRRQSGCGCGSGCLGSVMLIVTIFVIFAMALGSCSAGTISGALMPESSAQIRESTIQRQRLDSSSVKDVGYYTDHLGWISNSSALEEGLRYFFKQTGVSPYLYLTEEINGDTNPSDAVMEAFASQLYEDLFTDEAHFLVVFQEYESVYHVRYVCGYEARSVMDDEACEILLDYLQSYYYGDYDDETYFSQSFRDAADRIMGKKIPAAGYGIGIAVIVGVGLLIWLIWKKKTAYRSPKTADGEASPSAEIEELLEKADAQSPKK